MRELILTNDGTHTLLQHELNEHYHSKHGALAESKHVFIQEGFLRAKQNKSQLHILEVGLGTGLNAYLSLLENRHQPLDVFYTAIEAYPISLQEAAQLNYPEMIVGEKNDALFDAIHASAWEAAVELSPQFSLTKKKIRLQDFATSEKFDLIYFDAFSPGSQPELWLEEIFAKLHESLMNGGFLVTYCAKGEVKRRLKKVGFEVKSVPGPPGKREMTLAYKHDG